jgi:hypothetical protein
MIKNARKRAVPWSSDAREMAGKTALGKTALGKTALGKTARGKTARGVIVGIGQTEVRVVAVVCLVNSALSC